MNKRLKLSNSKFEEHVDNSELALLNTPRFNSFIRDFKDIAIKAGVSWYFESEHEEVTEQGILLDGELIYYEDIEDLLEDKYKIENLYVDLDTSGSTKQ